MITKLIQAMSRNMIGKFLDCFKHDFVNVITGATAPHHCMQGAHFLMYTGCLDGNKTHAHIAQRPEPNH
jgi:hypothetical protein